MRCVIRIFFLLVFCGAFAQTQTGKASFYADKFEGKPTASGEVYRHILPTAAHRTLPFGTKLKVTNLANNLWAIVTVNDRGPFGGGRILDVSKSVAEKLDFVAAGTANVKIEVLEDGEEEVVTTTPTTPVSDTLTATPAVPQTGEFYELVIDKVTPDWIGVQIGSFKELANLIALADDLKRKYKKEITVQVKAVEGNKLYALIVGKFTTRDKAEHLQEKLKEEYPGCFIVDMTK